MFVKNIMKLLSPFIPHEINIKLIREVLQLLIFQVSAKSINVHSREVADVHARSLSLVRLRLRVLQSNHEVRANKFMVRVYC